jgi:hypothetical protein
MARRAALMALALGLISCGSSDSTNNPWSCHWQCHIDNTSGNATYPSGTANPTTQCTADHGVGCSSFECNCTQ